MKRPRSVQVELACGLPSAKRYSLVRNRGGAGLQVVRKVPSKLRRFILVTWNSEGEMKEGPGCRANYEVLGIKHFIVEEEGSKSISDYLERNFDR